MTECMTMICPTSQPFCRDFRMNVKLSQCHLHPDQAAFYCSDLHLLFKLRYCDYQSEKEMY